MSTSKVLEFHGNKWGTALPQRFPYFGNLSDYNLKRESVIFKFSN